MCLQQPHGRDARPTLALIIVAVTGLAGILLMLLATRFGVGINPDSTVYLDAARNLLHGSGLSVLSGRSGELVPLTHYPPLYPALLALIGTSGISLESAARVLNAVLFGANITLVGVLISTYARTSFWFPVLGSILTLTAVDVARGHSVALTEPLFIFLTITGLSFLALYLERRRRRWLLTAAVATALSLLTRYVGVATVIAGCLVLLPGTARILRASDTSASALNGRAILRRLFDVFLFGAISCFPMFLWTIRNQLLSSETTDRKLVYHPVKLSQVVSGFSTVAQWLLLGKVSGGLRVVGFLIEIVILGGLVLYLRRAHAHPISANLGGATTKLAQVFGVFIVVYVLFLVFTASFVDADTVFDSRSLLPVHVAALILVPCLAFQLYRRSHQSVALRYGFTVLALLFVCSYGFRATNWFKVVQADAQGYASRAWKESGTIGEVKEEHIQSRPIYSNGFEAIYYLTGRRALSLPEKIVHGTGQANSKYEEEFQKMAIDLQNRRGVIVYFNTLPERSFLVSEAEISNRLALHSSGYLDGRIYFYVPEALLNASDGGRRMVQIQPAISPPRQ